MRAERVLVLAPHYDDEVLGCGGLIALLAADGAAVRVLFLTDSSGGGVEPAADPAAYAAARRAEAEAASAALGIAEVSHLGLADGGLREARDRLVEGVRGALVDHAPDLLLVTSPLEVSDDHRAAFAGLHDLLAGLRGGDSLLEQIAGLEILAYDVNHPLYPSLLVDVGAALPKIEAAIACYPSQTARHRYREACLGLLRYRTHSLPPDVEAAEGYVQLTVDDFRTRSLAGLVESMGGAPAVLPASQGPLLSVIVRTKDRPALLAEALASLGRSHYCRAEIIVVNDGGAKPDLPVDHPLEIRLVDLPQNRGRAAAANAGVAAAAGEAIVFLDDDDRALPEHLGTLAGLIGGAGVRVAYTDAAVGVYALDAESGWSEVERRLPYSRDFDPELLLYDNYIPFNTLVIERGLFGAVGTFDEDLPFFEDWDWLIRCAAHTRFHHLPRVTCEYRQFRGGGHHVLGDEPRRRADYLTLKARVIAKHAGRINAATAARVVDGLRAEAVDAHEAVRRLQTDVREAARSYHRINGALAAAAEERQAIAAANQATDAVNQALRAAHAALEARFRELAERLAERDTELRRVYGREGELEREVARLRTLVEAMESTRAWRAHQWLERRRGRG